MMVLAVIFFVGVYMLLRFLEPEKLARPEGMDAVAQYLGFLDAPTAPFLPSWWLRRRFFSLLGKAYKSVHLLFFTACRQRDILFYALCLTADKIFLKAGPRTSRCKKGTQYCGAVTLPGRRSCFVH